MPTFTINAENEIIAYDCANDASKAGDASAISFDSQEQLAIAAAEWPISRLIELWNSIPGNTPVKKFTDRKTAIARIWKAMQLLAGNARPSEPTTTPEPMPAEAAEVATPPEAGQPIERDEPTLARQPESETEHLVAATTEATQQDEVNHPEPDHLGDEVIEPAATDPEPKRRRKSAKAKQGSDEPTRAAEPMPERTNKKAEVIAMMKREGGVSLAEIMTATGWQKHTVRGFISILGGKGGLTIASTKSEAGDRVYRIAQ